MKTSMTQSKILVTGGALRIGKGIVEAFANAGAEVRIHCHKSLSQAEELRSSLLVKGDVVQADLLQADDRLLRKMLEGVGVLVNNASVFCPAGTFEQGQEEEIEKKHLKINYEIPLLLMELFAEKNPKGCIINLLDAAVLKPDSVSDSYSQSKFLLYLATRIKALEFAPDIRVNGVAPGSILPPSWLPDSLMEKSISEMPLQKAPTVEDVANACVFLAATEGITGEVIRVDGGTHLACCRTLRPPAC